MKHPTWRSEIKGMFSVLKTDVWIVAMFPMFWASNWFYTYQQSNASDAFRQRFRREQPAVKLKVPGQLGR